ncbi:flagellar basal body rod protein FlgC [Myxococcota bacterium]|nr:flagellar basal body rod protein FlgC [Myxococcota bacterium]
MNVTDLLQISGSALQAQQVRIQVGASNLANADATRSTDGGPYVRRQVVFRAGELRSLHPGASRSPFEETLRAVQVTGIQRDEATPLRRVHDPGHADAGADGYVLLPNVDPVTEMVDLIQASHSYEANLTAATTTRAMAMKALEIGR